MHRTWARLSLLGAAVSGCLAYKPPVLPEIPDRPPTATRIYISVQPGESWDEAVQLATQLEAAGFQPAVVSDPVEIPPDTAVVDKIRKELDSDESCVVGSPLLPALSILTLTVIPLFDCDVHGTTFHLRRTRESAPVEIDTRWRVHTITGWLAIPIGLVAGYRPLGEWPAHFAPREILVLRASVQDALDARPAP